MSAETMEAGREMDGRIALAVMGWRRGNTRRGDYPWITPEGKQRMITPDYSTDIAAAWQVMEKLAERFGHIEIGWLPHVMHQWEVYMRDRKVVTSDESAPLAICRAALMAIEAE